MAAGGSGLGVALAGAFLRDVDAAVDLVAVAAAGALVGYVAGLLKALVDLLVVLVGDSMSFRCRRIRIPVCSAGPVRRCTPRAPMAGLSLPRQERAPGRQAVLDCRGMGRPQPGPVWRSGRLDEPIDDVICQRGQFSLIQTARGRGWAASTDVSTNAFQRDGHDLVAGCDAFTWS